MNHTPSLFGPHHPHQRKPAASKCYPTQGSSQACLQEMDVFTWEVYTSHLPELHSREALPLLVKDRWAGEGSQEAGSKRDLQGLHSSDKPQCLSPLVRQPASPSSEYKQRVQRTPYRMQPWAKRPPGGPFHQPQVGTSWGLPTPMVPHSKQAQGNSCP